MRFGPVPTGDALGAILAHSVAVAGGRLRKGHVIGPADVTLLIGSGHGVVTVAQPAPDEVLEDPAAARLAMALAGRGVRCSAAATGRVNLYAEMPGVVRLDAAAIAAFNAVNPMITVATVPQLHRVDAGAMTATVKIISYAVPEADVRRAAAAAPQAMVIGAPRYHSATLIETQIGEAPSLKGRDALRGRLDRLLVNLDDRVVVAHDIDPLARALKAAKGEVLFVLTASATSDTHDVGPEAVRRAGGSIAQFGMPVDPGNLLFLGDLNGKPVIGLPGCARSPALNGADWVMERVICGITLTPADFAAMGVGGLLKEIPTRPQPRGDIPG